MSTTLASLIDALAAEAAVRIASFPDRYTGLFLYNGEKELLERFSSSFLSHMDGKSGMQVEKYVPQELSAREIFAEKERNPSKLFIFYHPFPELKNSAADICQKSYSIDVRACIRMLHSSNHSE